MEFAKEVFDLLAFLLVTKEFLDRLSGQEDKHETEHDLVRKISLRALKKAEIDLQILDLLKLLPKWATVIIVLAFIALSPAFLAIAVEFYWLIGVVLFGLYKVIAGDAYFIETVCSTQLNILSPTIRAVAPLAVLVSMYFGWHIIVAIYGSRYPLFVAGALFFLVARVLGVLGAYTAGHQPGSIVHESAEVLAPNPHFSYRPVD